MMRCPCGHVHSWHRDGRCEVTGCECGNRADVSRIGLPREVQEQDVLQAQVDMLRREVAELLRQLDAIAECGGKDPCRTRRLAAGDGGAV